METVEVPEGAQSSMESEERKRKRKRGDEEVSTEDRTPKEVMRGIDEDLIILINQEKEKKRMTVAMTSSLLDIKNRYGLVMDEMSTRVDMLQGRLDEVREQLLAERGKNSGKFAEEQKKEESIRGKGAMEERMEIVAEKKKRKRNKGKKSAANSVVKSGGEVVQNSTKPATVSYASVAAKEKTKAKESDKGFTVVKKKDRRERKEKAEEKLKERKPPTAFIVEKGQGSSEEARNRVWSSIVKKVAAPKVSAIRVLPRGDILVKPADEATARALVEMQQEGVRKEVTRKPKVLVYDVERSLKAEEIAEALARQNPSLGCDVEQMRAAVKPLFMKGPREDPLVRWICEVDPALYGKLIKKRFFIGMSLCKVVDFTEVLQCFKCQGFGHAEAKCRRAKVLCSHCGVEGHKQADCKAKDKAPKCVNCGLSFTAGHASCPVRKRFERTTLVRTDYGSSPK